MPRLVLPPDDNARSPHTGWTRAHWECFADHLLESLSPYASPGGALYCLPGAASISGPLSDGLEGFARSFLLAAFRLAGSTGLTDTARTGTARTALTRTGTIPTGTAPTDPTRAGVTCTRTPPAQTAGTAALAALAKRYARGLAAGTDPGSCETWPTPHDRSQPIVEAASVAVALHETRPWIWDRLDDEVKDRLADWLRSAAEVATWDNNWRLFPVVVQQFLAGVGAPFRSQAIEEGLDRIEDWYRGEGWYSDGDGNHFDHYNSWALHLYPLLWTRMAGEADGGRGAVYRDRLRTLLTSFPERFGADGAPVHHGRSLTYRFAAAVPVWAGALAGCTPLAPGLTRRLASGAARHFTHHGVPDGRGLLRVGWYGPHAPTAQSYSGPASPYWAAKGFLGLLLPPDHPVWLDTELPLPVEQSDGSSALRAPGWLLHRTRRDGIVRLLSHGACRDRDRDDPHYAAVAYSTATAPETTSPDANAAVGTTGSADAPVTAGRARPAGTANGLVLSASGGALSVRREVRTLLCTPDRIASRWSARVPGHEAATVVSVSVPHRGWELRVHRMRVHSTGPRTVAGSPDLRCYEGGWPVASDEGPPRTAEGSGWAWARTAEGLTSWVVALYGWSSGAECVESTGTNAFGRHSATPCLTREGPPPDGLLVALVRLSRDEKGAEAEQLPGLAARLHCTVDDGEVRVRMPDGRVLSA